jgi:hypothetical protein
MTPEVETRRNRWSPAVLAKLDELSQLISQEKYGSEGPPADLTWAEIEDVGHEIGRLAATEVDQTLQRQQAEKFDHPQACPQCGRPCLAAVQHRALETRDGPADLSEPSCYCDACQRSFFPSTRPLGSGR